MLCLLLLFLTPLMAVFVESIKCLFRGEHEHKCLHELIDFLSVLFSVLPQWYFTFRDFRYANHWTRDANHSKVKKEVQWRQWGLILYFQLQVPRPKAASTRPFERWSWMGNYLLICIRSKYEPVYFVALTSFGWSVLWKIIGDTFISGTMLARRL